MVAFLVLGVPFLLWFGPRFVAMHPMQMTGTPCHPACECVCDEGLRESPELPDPWARYGGQYPIDRLACDALLALGGPHHLTLFHQHRDGERFECVRDARDGQWRAERVVP